MKLVGCTGLVLEDFAVSSLIFCSESERKVEGEPPDGAEGIVKAWTCNGALYDSLA